MAKAKGKKRTESVRERQRRLLRERRQITRRGSSSPTSQRVEQVRVKVEGQKQLPAAKTQPQLPQGKQGGALSGTNRARRTNINRNQSSNTTRQGTSNAPNRPQPRLTARATAVPRGAAANLGAGIANVSGAISMLLAAGIISKDLADSLRRGEGYARIPGLLQRLAEDKSGPRRRGGQGGKNRGNISSNRTNNSGSSSSKPDDKTKTKGGPKEGDTKIVNNKRFVYRKGEWKNEGRPRTQGPPKPVNKDKDKPTNNNNNNNNERPTPKPKPKPTKRTGANDPRNAAYIAARSKLNANSTKEERDRVRDMGLAIHNKKFGKTTKSSPSSSKPSSTNRVNRSSSNGAPGAMSAAQREQERQRKEKDKKKKQRRKGAALAIGGYA